MKSENQNRSEAGTEKWLRDMPGLRVETKGAVTMRFQ